MGTASGERDSSTSQEHPRTCFSWGRWMLNHWWCWFALLAVSLFTNILLWMLANKPNSWWQEVQYQMAALLAQPGEMLKVVKIPEGEGALAIHSTPARFS